MISYNVLANLYLDLKLKQEDLHFPYCAKEYQNYDYRYPILLREIPGMNLSFNENHQNANSWNKVFHQSFVFIGYQADIIFLQEVDQRLWLRFLPEVMNSHGYDCHFKKKGMKVNEGLVVCFRREQFRYI